MDEFAKKPKRNDGNIIAGLILIVLGILFLIMRYFPELDFRDLWPYLLIIVGAFLLFTGLKNK